MTISDRDRKAIVRGVILLGVIVLLRFAIMPWADAWSLDRARSRAVTAEIADMQRELTRFVGQQARLKARYGEAACKPLDDVEAARVGLFSAAQEALKQNGFNPQSYQPQRPVDVGDLPGALWVPLEISGKCQTQQLIKSLAAMRKSPVLLIVSRITVNNDQKQPGQLEVSMTLGTLARQGGVQ